MSSSTPVAEPKRPGLTPAVPPEPEFWKHYSPHGEAPLSLAGSLALHALIAGGVVLCGIYLAALFFKPSTSIPVEPVRLEHTGGTQGAGVPDGDPGEVGKGVENIGQTKIDDVLHQAGLDAGETRPALDPIQQQKVEEKYDPDTVQFLKKSTSENVAAWTRLEENTRQKLADGLKPNQGKGKPGTRGSGGGGTGTGEGAGSESGKRSNLGARERRMLRWTMSTRPESALMYLAQLRDLGAILAFPVQEGPEPVFKLVRDLRPGAQLLDDDLSKLNRIYWIDDNPNSAAEMIQVLGIRLSSIPTRFLFFLPVELEAEMIEMEKNYVTRVLRRPYNEENIVETHFEIRRTPRGYEPHLVRSTVR